MPPESQNLRNELAFHYYTDATDFLARFDFLIEEYSKTMRFKCFVDLLMGFECILKSHIFLSSTKESMVEIYKNDIRKSGHKLSNLADEAKFLSPDIYQRIKVELGQYDILIRYSIDGYANFIPSYLLSKDNKFNFSNTLTNTTWLTEKRNLLEGMINSTSIEFQREWSMDFPELVADEQELMEFFESVKIIK
ncbi:MAG TPA: hypothetical protein VL995_18325 [Cellvibrio sp.]|nr:hypothetical protein [Cellvibrio sp.]